MNGESFIRTGRPEFDNLIPQVRSFLEKDLLELEIEGEKIRGYRSPDTPAIWIRDYSDMLRGIRYFEVDLKTTVQHFADNQSVNGRIFDYFTTIPEKKPCEKENWTKYVRVPVEADVEYRFVKAAFLSWQANGDDEWIRALLPNMERAVGYALNSPQRFDKASQLVKRPYTIDTWDFAYTAGKHDWLQFQIDKNTFWGISHADNSGYYEALKILETLFNYFDDNEKAARFSDLAAVIKLKCNEYCWNGSFFTHFVKLNSCHIQGVDEAIQLSMSNPMAISRGLTTVDQARSILDEYQKRRSQKPDYFAEWYSIDPPFPDGIFGDEKLLAGAYINGGIFPLVGGELAKAAFSSGYETYGVDILRRYNKLISEHNGSWLWYFPDGTPSSEETSTSPEATSTDGWGSTAMLDALVSGLAGVVDNSKGFQDISLSPRWLSAGVKQAHVKLSYPSSGAVIEYKFNLNRSRIEMELKSSKSKAELSILLPLKQNVTRVKVDSRPTDYKLSKVGDSRYVNFKIDVSQKSLIIVDLKE